MTWNYRIVEQDDGTHALIEVYYDEHGAITAYAAEPESLGHYESPEELRGALSMMVADAWLSPPLKASDLPTSPTSPESGHD